MKKKALTICLGLTIFLGFAQQRNSEIKIDSPYRLIKGVTLVTDLRMKATIVNEVKYIKIAPTLYPQQTMFNIEVPWQLTNRYQSITDRRLNLEPLSLYHSEFGVHDPSLLLINLSRSSFQRNLMEMPAIVVDGLLMNSTVLWPNLNSGFNTNFDLN